MSTAQPPPKRPPLGELLRGYRAAVITEMARLAGIDPRGTGKEALATHLAKLFGQPEQVKTRLAGLDPAARMALDHIQRAGGYQTREALVDSLGELGDVTPPKTKRTYAWSAPERVTGSASARGSRAFQDVLARLEASGLALGRGPAQGSVLDLGVGREFVIPAEIWPRLPSPAPLPELPPPRIEREEQGDAAETGRRLFFLWRFIARTRPTLLKTGLLSKSDLKLVCAELGIGVDIKAVASEAQVPEVHFDRLLLADLDLIRGAPGGRLDADEAAAAPFWAQPLAGRVYGCLVAYLVSRSWNELAQLRHAAWQPAYGHERSTTPEPVTQARALVATLAGKLDRGGAWVGVPVLLRELKLAHRDFLIDPGPPPRTGYGYYGYGRQAPPEHRYHRDTNRQAWSFGSVNSGTEGWKKVEGDFVRQVLRALHRLGLADLGLGKAGDEVAWRLTALGRHLLARGEAPEEEAPAGERIVVQPNFQIVALGPVPVTTLHEIEQFADRVSTDRAITYGLTRASLYRGQQNGWDGSRVIARLAELSGAELPQNVARTIAEWQALHERIVVRTGLCLIQSADSELLDRLAAALAGAKPGAVILDRLAPTLAAAGATPPVSRALATALGALEIHPRSVAVRDPRGTLRVGEDGTVTPLHPVLDVATLGWLQKLAEPEAGGRWRVTATSARAAQERLGQSGEVQVARWEALQGGALPGSLALRIKAWTGHYGAARRIDGIVLELPDAAALEELAIHPDLARALRPVTAAGPLVSIAEADYAWVAQRLRELGLDLPEAP